MKFSAHKVIKSGLLLGMLGAGLLACGQSNGDGNGSGGTTGASGGASSSSGGHTGSGGATSSGGTTSTGGTTAGSGGTKGTGGVTATGGSTSSGGSATGGAVSPGSGGSTATGGVMGGGGAKATGGVIGSGGAAGTGSGGGHKGGPGGASASGGAGGGAATGGSSGTVTCPSAAAKPGDTTKKIMVGTLSREYILHIPSGYTGATPVPFVVDFHPIGGSDTQWRSASPYPAVIDKEGVVSAFPNGQPSPNLGNAWDVEGCCNTADDVAFARALVADVESAVCVDTKRVYAVGFSMGGGMSNYLGCHAADLFAAVGPASFDLTMQNVGDCKPSRPLTVIEWRGKKDTVVPYAGGPSMLVTGMSIDFLGAVGTFQKWASLDMCTGSPGAADSNNCQTYSQCGAGVQVTLCTDDNGQHEAANATIVWPMLKKYTLP